MTFFCATHILRVIGRQSILLYGSLNAELGRLCPFSAPRGHTFSTCPPRFPPRVFHGQIFTPEKHKVSAPNAPHPKLVTKSDPNYSPLKKLKRLEKIDFQVFNTLLLH